MSGAHRLGASGFADMSLSGKEAELIAAQYLRAQGLAILSQNYRCRGGEIDLVCRDGRTLVFVEVRYRANTAYGSAAESITIIKQRRIILAARHYLAGLGAPEPQCRFDALLIEGRKEAGTNHLQWLKNAFESA